MGDKVKTKTIRCLRCGQSATVTFDRPKVKARDVAGNSAGLGPIMGLVTWLVEKSKGTGRCDHCGYVWEAHTF